MEIGAQLYTVTKSCQTLEDLAETLKRVADIGYPTVQVSGTCEYEPEWLAEQLKKNGLKCVITHTPADKLIGNTEQVIKDNEVFGCNYIGLGMHKFPDGEEEQSFDDFVRLYKPVAEQIRKSGKYFMYHNHHYEYKILNGKSIMERLAETFSPEEMGFTLDVFWVQAGGGDPAQWLEKLKGRVPCIHLKDLAYNTKYCVLGEGNMNFDRIFEKAEVAGTKYMLVEQDKCYDDDPFDCLKRSYQYLKAHGF